MTSFLFNLQPVPLMVGGEVHASCHDLLTEALGILLDDVKMFSMHALVWPVAQNPVAVKSFCDFGNWMRCAHKGPVLIHFLFTNTQVVF